jgi:hypothetical protein
MAGIILPLVLLILAGAIAWAAVHVASAVERAQRQPGAGTLHLLQLFAPAITSSGDPHALIAWQGLARTARALFPRDFDELDRAHGGTFPFTAAHLQAAHARWTAEWLAWERAHDAEYKLKAAEAEAALAASGGTPLMRARLDAVEREKLETYQRRYEEYVRVAKALQAISGPA